MTLPLTHNNNMEDWKRSVWKILPTSNAITLFMNTTAGRMTIRNGELGDVGLLGAFRIIESRGRRTIDRQTHETLLEKGIRDYEDIWKSLAQK